MKAVLLVSMLAGWGCALRVRRVVGGDPSDPPVPPKLLPPDHPHRPRPVPPRPVAAPGPALGSASIKVSGLVLPDGSHAYVGIQYALPPVGPFRFQRPKRIKLRGEISATKYKPPCPQLDETTGKVHGEEDCLYLNVYAPKESSQNSSLPVLFWIHGGNFRVGSGSQYDPSPLVSKGMVVVTIQYRLGSLGFLSLGVEELPGNVGLYDVAAALKWTSRYISFFGGDPKRITTAGQGSGGSIATFLAMNNNSAVYVNGIIGMSGTALSPFSTDKNETGTAQQVSVTSGGTCTPGKTDKEKMEFVKCMQGLTVEQLIKGDFKTSENKMKSGGLIKSLVAALVPAPVEEKPSDDRFLPSFLEGSPISLIKKGKLSKNVPLLTGVTKEETGGAIKGSFLDSMKKMLGLGNQIFNSNTLFKDLYLANTGLYANKTADPKLTSLFSSSTYINFFTSLANQVKDSIGQLIKFTTDALFNLPVFVISHLWSEKSTIYLYSFEHGSDHSEAGHFLHGLPLAGINKPKKDPQHGDDLMYIFRPQTLFGEPIEYTPLTGDDLIISQYMTNMVYTFTRDGKPRIKEGVNWSKFSPARNNYMVISTEPHEADNFHKCDMGLWSASTDILKSVECNSVLPGAVDTLKSLMPGGSSLLKGVSGVKDTFTSGVSMVASPISSAAKPITSLSSGLGGLFGSGSSSSATSTPKPQSMKPAFGGFGGILG